LPSKQILIDICHPAEVHHFIHLYAGLIQNDWEVLFAAKRKDVTEALLIEYNLPFVIFANNQKGLWRKICYLPVELWRFHSLVRRFKPSVLVSNLSLHSSWIGWIHRLTHIAFVDTEERRLLDLITAPLAQVKLTGRSYYGKLGRHHYTYPGNHELAYLHPKHFKPDSTVLSELGLKAGEPFVIVRLIAWQAFHDAGLSHMDLDERMQLIGMIVKKKRLFISTESPLPAALEPYRFPLPAGRLHDALAFTDLYVGEGITMASEAAVLGTPAVLLNPLQMGYCLEEERQGLLFRFDRLGGEATQKIAELLELADIREVFREKYRHFISSMIDVTAFMTWFIDCYPESLARMREDPGYAGRFV